MLQREFAQMPYCQSWLFWGGSTHDLLPKVQDLAQWRLCEKRSDTQACGQCPSCHWFSANTHPDYLYLTPEKDNGTITVDAIRSIHAFCAQTSHSGQHRIIVISPADSMNISAANALLKILEEPPVQCLFFLIAHQIDSLLPTIKSRCQKRYIATPEAVINPDRLAAIESILTAVSQKKINPIIATEQLIQLEKKHHITFTMLLDDLLHITHQRSCLQPESRSYLFYDKLIQIKRECKFGFNLNESIVLESMLLKHFILL